MRFDVFSKIISTINSFALPGMEAQMLMAPPFRAALLKQSVTLSAKDKLAAVMALFYPNKQGETQLVFIVRKSSPGVHSGQIGFPGGKPELGDVDLKATAVRQLHQMRINCQMLGQVLPMHIDQSMRYNRPYWRKIWLEGGGDKDPDKLRRILVNLTPWEYGHVWHFGSHFYSHYPAGEAITFNCWNAPHGTGNLGFSPRVTLQITGFISDKTKELIANGSRDRVIDV